MSLLKKARDKKARYGILGLGYVGIPLAVTISQVGSKVIGFDVDEERVQQLNKCVSPIKHIPSAIIEKMVDEGFQATTDFSLVADCDVLIICVPTPLDKMREPDLSFVISTVKMIAPYLREEQALSLESTTWPGTTQELILPMIEEQGLKVGENFYLVYSPEREDPGNEKYSTRTIPKIVGGHTTRCLEIGSLLYGSFIDKIVEVSSTQAAEMVKLLENIHRSINIGLMNEMKVVTDAMDLDIFEIVDAAKTKPFGFTPYYPGPGVGGHCIPIDPFYLTWKARQFGLHTRFIELAGEVNASMPDYIVKKLTWALNEKGKSIKDSKILALGIAYKPNVDDMRESPSVFVMEILREWGAKISYSDPHVPHFPTMREHDFDLSSVNLTKENIEEFDAVIILTDHTAFDYDFIYKHAKLVVDTRGKLRGMPGVVRA